MIGRLALRSLTAHPVRSAVLAAGFGAGVGVMAILLGVAQVVLQQAQAPALVGGGDVIIRLGPDTPARLVLSGTLQSDGLRERTRVAAPFHTTDVFLLPASGPDGAREETQPAAPVRVSARGGIPSLERALGDEETSGVDDWVDSPADVAWTRDSPDRLLRHIDRFRPIPDAPAWEDSWAEWLYFNGRGPEGRFYLTLLAGPRTDGDRRSASVRLQLERNGRIETFSASAELTEEEVQRAPDLAIGSSSVTLVGMQYRIELDLPGADGRRAVGTLTLEASPGRLVPPVEITGAGGWLTGYVVPVTSGRLDGFVEVDGERVSFDGGTGYHDHNWGFWDGVTWQWGQVQHEDLSFIYGRVFPPPEAADPEGLPGFVGALGAGGPIGFATDVQITETNDEQGRPRTLEIRARGAALDLTLRFDVESAVSTTMTAGPLGSGLDLLQMRGRYTVTGQIADRPIDFAAPGAAETFRGP